MADVAALEVYEFEHRSGEDVSKSPRRHLLDSVIDFTGGVMG